MRFPASSAIKTAKPKKKSVKVRSYNNKWLLVITEIRNKFQTHFAFFDDKKIFFLLKWPLQQRRSKGKVRLFHCLQIVTLELNPFYGLSIQQTSEILSMFHSNGHYFFFVFIYLFMVRNWKTNKWPKQSERERDREKSSSDGIECDSDRRIENLKKRATPKTIHAKARFTINVHLLWKQMNISMTCDNLSICLLF